MFSSLRQNGDDMVSLVPVLYQGVKKCLDSPFQKVWFLHERASQNTVTVSDFGPFQAEQGLHGSLFKAVNHWAGYWATEVFEQTYW